MKKSFLLAALVGVALTSCTKNEPVAPAPQGITFEVGTYAPQTRANVNLGETITFGAYAYVSDAQTATTPQNFMVNQKVAYNGAEWAPTTTYYWPGSFVDFICYAPYMATPDASVPVIGGTDNATLSYTNYEVPTDMTAQKDLLYGDKAENYKANATDPHLPLNGFDGVPTLFHHALAKINFTVATAKTEKGTAPDVTTWETTINSITLSNIATKGSISMTATNAYPAAGATVAWVPASTVWTKDTPTTKADKAWTKAQLLDLAPGVEYVGATATDKTTDFYVMPQDIADDLTITINYTIVTTTGAGVTITNNYVYSEKMNTFKDSTLATINKWEMAKNYTYNITINPEGSQILFAPAVVDWTDVEGIGIGVSPIM